MNLNKKFSNFIEFDLATLESRKDSVQIVGLGDNGFSSDKNIRFDLNTLSEYLGSSFTDNFKQDGNEFGEDAVLGTKDNFALNFITNDTLAMVLATDGTLKHLNEEYFDTEINIRGLGTGGNSFGNVYVGNDLGNSGNAYGRKINIGQSNNMSSVSSAPYGQTIGYANTHADNKGGLTQGAFNINRETAIIRGFSNNNLDGAFSIIDGSNNIINHVGTTLGLGVIINGNNNRSDHLRTGIIGHYQQTISNNEFIIAQQEGNVADGFNIYRYGTGSIRLDSYSDFMNDVWHISSGAANLVDKNGASMINAGGEGTGAGIGGDYVVATTSTLASGSTRQTYSNRLRVKFNSGFVGVATDNPTSLMDLNAVNGYEQLRLRTSYTPSSTGSAFGNTGDTCWDDDFWYIKTSIGWRRATLASF